MNFKFRLNPRINSPEYSAALQPDGMCYKITWNYGLPDAEQSIHYSANVVEENVASGTWIVYEVLSGVL